MQIMRRCENCQQTFRVKQSAIARGRGRFCSRRCKGNARTPADLTERFWSKVDTSAGPDVCWPWKGTISKKTGYGSFSINRSKTGQPAHRVAYILAFGQPLPGRDVAHTCDNRACVNLTHLIQLTPKGNSLDMLKKGRAKLPSLEQHARGERVNTAKLTAEQVRLIRLQSASVRESADRYGVQETTIRRILTRRTWTHI